MREEPMPNLGTALVVAKADTLREALLAVLSTIPGLVSVYPVEDPASAVRAVLERHPTVVLLESGLPGDEALAALRRIRAEAPETRCVLLVEDVRQRRAAKAAGANAALVKGCLSAELIATVESLLPLKETASPPSHAWKGGRGSRSA